MTAYERHDARTEEPRPHWSPAGGEPAAGGVESQAEAGSGRPKVLARLPNLDVAELDRIVGSGLSRPGRRNFSQRVSAAILVGGAALLLIVAFFPHAGGKKGTNPTGDTAAWQVPPPAPTAPLAPAWGGAVAQDGAIGLGGAPGSAVSTPTSPITIQAVPASIPSGSSGSPSATMPGATGAPTTMPMPALPSTAPPSTPTPIPAMPSTSTMPLGSAQGLASGTSQAPAWSDASRWNTISDQSVPATSALPSQAGAGWGASSYDPPLTADRTALPVGTYPTTPYAAGYELLRPNPGYYGSEAATQATPNQAMTIGQGIEYRTTTADSRMDASAGYQGGGSSARWYAPQAGTPASDGAATGEPGVARLEGVIEKSTNRPTSDTARPSLH